MKTEKEYNDAHDALERAGWAYLGAGEFRDPMTGTKLLLNLAHKVMVQRAKREAILKGIKLPKRKPRLIHWQDWMGIAQELRRQLKPFGLTVKTCGHMLRNGDFIRWTVSKTP